MIIDAHGETANVLISRLRAEARRTREPRAITVKSRSERIAGCALAWAQTMGYSTGPVDNDRASFRVWFTPAAI